MFGAFLIIPFCKCWKDLILIDNHWYAVAYEWCVSLCYVKSIAKNELDVKKPFFLLKIVLRYKKYGELKR
ncbi:hypothetical protein EAI88_08295 [Eubacterium ramulus]|jgi:hypothetical protein|uniref:Uncharacterized protein n=1 Tax=Eubacterium ramulus ATCC 29099 TaxID=1256908 RepID=U2RFY4_EUBRA|nr:hypothetical protein HMPREF0373_01014 [Eubacterium ramulus ATCC 29099]RYS97605.1 hypothetical protein EAI88_08295 [Eubacterium ramulus]